MPTYNYYCSDCDTHFSYFQKMSESPVTKCENCGGRVKRLITGGTGLIFKGSGFYLTDYKNGEKSISSDSTSSSGEKGEEKSEKPEQKDKLETNDAKPGEKATQLKGKKTDE